MKVREWVVQDLGAAGEVLRDAVVPASGLEIGRTAEGLDCPDDPQMSAQHARLFVKEGSAFVEDLDSATGVWLRVPAGKGWGLREDDQIWLGSQILLVRRREELWELRHHGPDGRLREKYRVPDAGLFLGRTSDLVLDREDSRLSRRHAQVVHEEGRLRLYDRGAHNGTYIKLGEPVPLQDGDEFRLATHRFRIDAVVEQAEAPAEQPPPEEATLLEAAPQRAPAARPNRAAEPSSADQALNENRSPGLAARLKRLGRREDPVKEELQEELKEEAVVEVVEVTQAVEAEAVEEDSAADASVDFEETAPVRTQSKEAEDGGATDLSEEATVMVFEEEAAMDAARTFELVLERGAEGPPVQIQAAEGQTLLDAVKAAGLERGEPVDWECGDGGCGVCVVGLVGGADGLVPPDPLGDEMKTIQITEQVAPDPEKYRLACLARVRGNVRLRRL
ncbi:MAG: FHA domain-containing protein [Myxococcota bacterium]